MQTNAFFYRDNDSHIIVSILNSIQLLKYCPPTWILFQIAIPTFCTIFCKLSFNTRVTSNGNSGVRAQEASSLHMYGEKTLIEKNCSRPSKTQNLRSGLFSSDTSIIYIHEPLSLECSRNNANGNDKKGAVVVVP